MSKIVDFSILSPIKEENESELSTENEEKKTEENATSSDNSTSVLSIQTKTFSIDSDASSFRCFKDIVASSSSIFTNLMYFFPEYKTDPGIDEAMLRTQPPKPEDYGVKMYRDLCKELKICPISRVCNSLNQEVLNLKFYVPFENQMKAICKTIEGNHSIIELNLEYNNLSEESCGYLANVLHLNKTIQILRMKECRIGPEGMAILNDSFDSSTLTELDLSFNSLGDEGLQFGYLGLSLIIDLRILNLSHNDLTEVSAPYLQEILENSVHLRELDLSWNLINTPKVLSRLTKAFIAAYFEISSLNLSWNGISHVDTIKPLARYLINANCKIEFLDLSHNLLKDEALEVLMKCILLNRSLKHVKIGNNTFGPDQAYDFAQILLKRKSLEIIDMENMVVKKHFLKLRDQIVEMGKVVIFGTVLGNYEIHGPYLPKLLFARAKYLGMKPKKKKKKVDFGQFVLSLPDEPVASEQFDGLLVKKKLKKLIDFNLRIALKEQYRMKKTNKIDSVKLKSDFMILYPETELIPPKPKKKPAKKGGKKGKAKSKNKGEKDEKKSVTSQVSSAKSSIVEPKIEAEKITPILAKPNRDEPRRSLGKSVSFVFEKEENADSLAASNVFIN